MTTAKPKAQEEAAGPKTPAAKQPQPPQKKKAARPKAQPAAEGPDNAPKPQQSPASAPKPAKAAAPAQQSQAAPQTPAQTKAQVPPQASSQGQPQAQPAPGPAAAPQPGPKPAASPNFEVRPPVTESRPRRRHFMLALSFVLLVLAPAAASAVYLWGFAKDQYVSHVAFSVRSEQPGSAMELLGGLSQVSGSSSSDTDILYKYIQSQELVKKIDSEIDLRTIWSKAGPAADPIFSYHPPGTIEDLVEYWNRMVQISYDAAGGLLELRVLAFEPEDAHLIAEHIYAESTALINELSQIAREDAIRYAREDLDEAVETLKQARSAVTGFRNRYQIVDPTIDTQDQMGVVSSLQQQLAASLVELDILNESSQPNDPRVTQLERKIRVIEKRIEEERRKVGVGTGAQGGEVMADIVGEYERLSVDQQFAEQTYTTTLATFNAARAEAGRQSRYLAAHVKPTQAERATYPQRPTLLALITGFLLLSWSVLVLVAYSLRDRR